MRFDGLTRRGLSTSAAYNDDLFSPALNVGTPPHLGTRPSGADNDPTTSASSKGDWHDGFSFIFPLLLVSAFLFFDYMPCMGRVKNTRHIEVGINKGDRRSGYRSISLRVILFYFYDNIGIGTIC